MYPMPRRPQAQTRAKTRVATLKRSKGLDLLQLVALTTLLMLAAFAARAGETTISHAFNYFGAPKYAADFDHLDYVNPDAPKGGEVATWTMGSFDNFKPVLGDLYYPAGSQIFRWHENHCAGCGLYP
ncbi:MAG: hypothetical protein P8X69_01610 [Maritimibacter sp.]